MNSLCFMNGNKINSPDITVIFITFNENRIQIIINVCFKFIEIIFLDPSKAIMDITLSMLTAYPKSTSGKDR